MIKIEEKPTTKLPGLSSLYISFDYKPEIVEIIKNHTTVRQYDAKNKIWEVPISDLHFLLDKLCQVDNDILLTLLKDKKEKKLKAPEIGPFKVKPFYYQEDAIKYGLLHPKWLLLDLPGLGKTLSAMYLAEEIQKRDKIDHCLIICGINTLKTNWKKEILKFSKLSCMILGERINKKGKITFGGTKERLADLKKPIKEFFVITNIETLRNTDIVKELTKGKANKFDMIVLDESHCCKDPTSQLSKGLMKLKSKYKLAMTGTVLLNSPCDGYMPLKWIDADNSTYSNFKYYYCNYSGPFNNILVGYRNIKYLKDQLNSCSLRRTKDILDLPPKTIIDEYVDMDDSLKTFYEHIVQGIIDEVDKVHMSTANLLAMTTRLRLATACPDILTTEKIPSAKIDRAIDLANLIAENGDKVVIFSTFKETVNKLNTALAKYNPLICTGDIKDAEISANVDKFQTTTDNKVMIATWQKMGTGITLTAASYAIFIDTPWTAGQFELCSDRIHRVGTKDPVFIYCLWSRDTIDERVKEILDDKSIISDYVVDNKVSPKFSSRLKEIILDLKK